MTRRALILQIIVVTLLAFAIGLWLLSSMMVSYIGMGAGRTEAEIIRELYHFCILPPEWIRPPNHWEKWELLEMYARSSVVILACSLGVATLFKRYLRGQRCHLTSRCS